MQNVSPLNVDFMRQSVLELDVIQEFKKFPIIIQQSLCQHFEELVSGANNISSFFGEIVDCFFISARNSIEQWRT